MYSDHPSIQGAWTPFTNADPAINLAQLPDVSTVASLGSAENMLGFQTKYFRLFLDISGKNQAVKELNHIIISKCLEFYLSIYYLIWESLVSGCHDLASKPLDQSRQMTPWWKEGVIAVARDWVQS